MSGLHIEVPASIKKALSITDEDFTIYPGRFFGDYTAILKLRSGKKVALKVSSMDVSCTYSLFVCCERAVICKYELSTCLTKESLKDLENRIALHVKKNLREDILDMFFLRKSNPLFSKMLE